MGVDLRVYMGLCGVSLWKPVGLSLWVCGFACGKGLGREVLRGSVVYGEAMCLCTSVPVCVSMSLCP